MECPSCSAAIKQDPGGRLPPWCPACGSDLKPKKAPPPPAGPEPSAAPPAEQPQEPASPKPEPIAPIQKDPAEPISRRELKLTYSKRAKGDLQPASTAWRWAILLIAVACGLLMAFLVAQRHDPEQPAVLSRDHFQIQPPHQGWKPDPDRQWLERADLALRHQHRGGDASYFVVQVLPSTGRPVALNAFMEAVRKDWLDRRPAAQIFEAESGPTKLAGQPALRLTAKIGQRRRQVIGLIHQGTGFRLICEADDQRFAQMKDDFDLLLASFQPGPPGN